MPVEEFVAKVKATRRAPMVIKAVPLGKAIDKRDTNTLSLFDMMTPVKGYTRSNGRFVAQYVAKRRHSAEAAQPDRPATSVFEPTQIKSVFNRGTFDPRNPDILRQDGVRSAPTEETIARDASPPEVHQWVTSSSSRQPVVCACGRLSTQPSSHTT